MSNGLIPGLVSIVVPAYNHERFVCDALRSIAEQSHPNIEIIVINDGSKDDTGARAEACLKQLGRPYVYESQVNQGVCATLNRGLTHVKGEFFGILASDDMLEPGVIERHIQRLRREPPSVGGVFGDMVSIDEFGVSGRRLSFAPPHDGNLFLDFLMGWASLPIQVGLFRTAAVRSIGSFDTSLAFEDTDFVLRFLREFDYLYEPGLAAKYRFLPTGLGRSVHKFQSSIVKLTEKQMDAPQLQALGRFSQRRVRGAMWARLADLHLVNCGRRRDAAPLLLKAYLQWPFEVRTLKVTAVALLGPTALQVMKQGIARVRHRA